MAANRTPDNQHSSPLSRVFSKIFGRDEHPATPTPQATPRPAPTTQPAPGLQTRPAQPTQHATTAPTPQATSSTAHRPDFGNVASGSSTAPATAPAPAGQRTHTVAKGETLSKIAQQAYGNANRWKLIFDANRDKLDDPDRIYPGQVLVIPPAPTTH